MSMRFVQERDQELGVVLRDIVQNVITQIVNIL